MDFLGSSCLCLCCLVVFVFSVSMNDSSCFQVLSLGCFRTMWVCFRFGFALVLLVPCSVLLFPLCVLCVLLLFLVFLCLLSCCCLCSYCFLLVCSLFLFVL